MTITSSTHIQLMRVTPDDVALRVDQNGAVHLSIGDRSASVVMNPSHGTTKEGLTNLRLIAARIDELAHAELRRILRDEYDVTPLEEIGETEFLAAHGINRPDDAELASLDERDPGPSPAIIDADGTIEATGVEVAA